jgi:RNA polymerase sigma-70 factor (ECF subfamily)
VPTESSTQLSERELISRVLAGEREHFHELLRPYERAMYITAFSILRNQADTEEAVQEAVLKAMTHLGQLSDHAKFKGWLLQIATNEARLKRRSRHEKFFESLEEVHKDDKGHEFMPHDFADWREIPSETLERKEVRRAVAAALHKLPEIYREIFILRDVEDLNISECCEVLGISEQAVKVRLHRARLRIREELAPVFKANWFSRVFSFKGKKIW